MLASLANESATSTQSGAMKNATNSAASGRTRGESVFLIVLSAELPAQASRPWFETRSFAALLTMRVAQWGAAAHPILILRSHAKHGVSKDGRDVAITP